MTTSTTRNTPTVMVDAAPSTLAEQRLRLVPRRVWLPRAAESPGRLRLVRLEPRTAPRPGGARMGRR